MHILFPFSMIDLVEPSFEGLVIYRNGFDELFNCLPKKEFTLLKWDLFSVFLYFIFNYENSLYFYFVKQPLF